MDNQLQPKKSARALEYILFVLAGINCISITASLFYSEVALSDGRIENVFPFPGIYFIELIAIGITCLLTVFLLNEDTLSTWSPIAWICSGLLIVFSILHAWTIGFFLIPGMIMLLVVGILIDKRTQRNYALHLIYLLSAGLAQAIFVFLMI